MKRLAAGVLSGFAVLLAATVFIALRSYEGLVERNYYESSASEFSGREQEARAGLRTTVPDRYRVGESRFAAVLGTDDGPLGGALVTLDAIRPSGTEDDRSFRLREESAGTYAADIVLPRPGIWMLSLTVEAERFRTRRRWTVMAVPVGTVDPPGTFRAMAGTQEVTLSLSPLPLRAMRETSFYVELPGYSGEASPYADLSMPGMEMGRNRVALARIRDGHYRGTGVFVRCPSGNRVWETSVSVPERGKAVFRIELAD